MERFELTDRVRLEGPNFLGRRAHLTLEPSGCDGWVWLVNGRDVPITPKLLHYRESRLTLEYGRHRLNVWEHIGAFRFLGLEGVRVVSDPWPPYDGCGKELGAALAHKLRPAGYLRPYTISTTHVVTGRRVVGFEPWYEGPLRVEVHLDFPGLGSDAFSYRFPSPDFSAFAEARAPGWGRSRKAAAWLASCWPVRWPHYRNIEWPNFANGPETLQRFALHRAFDILGALSVIAPPGEFLVGTYSSSRAGHKEDVLLVGLAEAYKTLCHKYPGQLAAE